MPTVAACSLRLPGRGEAVFLAALVALLALAGCRMPAGDHAAEFFVFGTRVEVSVREASEDNANGAFRALNADFRRMHAEWHPWEPGALMELNRGLASGGWVRTTSDLVRLLEASQEMERASEGLFNAAIGELVSLWGFHTSDYPITEPPPDTGAIHAALAWRPTTLNIETDGTRVRTGDRGIRLDFSGIAKGLAVLNACQRLEEFRITDALINAGGDVLVCSHTDRPWRVAIRDPAGGVLTTVELTEPQAVFTSGNYQRFGEWEGERYAHILDPRTGRPVAGVLQATVIHPDPLTADAAATALVVAGPLAWQRIAAGMGIEQAIVVGADGRVETTEAVASPRNRPGNR